MKDTKSHNYMLMKPMAHGPIALKIFMECSFLSNLICFNSLIIVRLLLCFSTDEIGCIGILGGRREREEWGKSYEIG